MLLFGQDVAVAPRNAQEQCPPAQDFAHQPSIRNAGRAHKGLPRLEELKEVKGCRSKRECNSLGE